MHHHKPSVQHDDTTERLLRILVWAPNLILLYYLFTLEPTLNGTSPSSIEAFKHWRNLMYTGYVLLFALAGILRLAGWKKASLVIPLLVQQLILTTFAYAIVGFLKDLYTVLLYRF